LTWYDYLGEVVRLDQTLQRLEKTRQINLRSARVDDQIQPIAKESILVKMWRFQMHSITQIGSFFRLKID